MGKGRSPHAGLRRKAGGSPLATVRAWVADRKPSRLLHYVLLNTADLQRSAGFYDAVLSPLGWRRQEESAGLVGWGLTRAVFYVSEGDSQRPGFGHVSFAARSIPAVKAAFESGVESGGSAASEPGAAPAAGVGSYAARLYDPDGYLVEFAVAHV